MYDIYITVKCPRCESENIRKFGFDKIGNQRYECRNTNCKKNTFILNYCNKACSEDINDKIIKMTLNGSGIRDISRVLGISTYKVMNELKKKENLLNKVNISLINSFDNINDLKIDIVKIDEMRSFVYSKKQQR